MKLILIHYAELSLKGKNRREFERQLAKNLKHLFRPIKIEREHGRMMMHMEGIEDGMLDHLALVPGITTSTSFLKPKFFR